MCWLFPIKRKWLINGLNRTFHQNIRAGVATVIDTIDHSACIIVLTLSTPAVENFVVFVFLLRLMAAITKVI
jgi:hypothetical protein